MGWGNHCHDRHSADNMRLIVRRYAKERMPKLIRLLTDFHAKLLAQGWDGKVAQ
jgi:hypothetical protein